ncbi:hypothetical protein GCM10027445_45460 [Amycolatopsis endophytica]|uniref:Uncharacterized protein n=1 Tax=Amycolatopsis endophytica TaxID=860233 RepID=A0A853B199_9PSEU|nr:hypothetical protein [Amycolatopsis endophytica]
METPSEHDIAANVLTGQAKLVPGFSLALAEAIPSRMLWRGGALGSLPPSTAL